MSFLHEKQSRQYMLFLCLVCVCITGFFALACCLQAKGTQRALLERERAIASSLLSSGVSPMIVAQAYGNEESTAEGISFLERAGLWERSNPWLLWTVRRATEIAFPFLMGGACFLSAVLLAGTFLFLMKREKLYQEAAQVIGEYAEGNFTHHLKRDQEGTLYQLFGAAEQLSKALQARGETLLWAKEFLKETVSDISHQLKTPLSALSMYTEIILEETDNPRTVQKFTLKSVQSLARMETLIGTLLKVMRLDAGSVLFEKRACRMESLLSDALGQLYIRAERENKRILQEGDPEAVLVCDPVWTAEALSALAKNALDHTEAGGTVRIGWKRTRAMLRLWVADDGCGIDPEDMPHIFKRFYRSKNSGDTQGAGLGLALAKSIVEGQEGILTAESVPGEGAAFFITFLKEELLDA